MPLLYRRASTLLGVACLSACTFSLDRQLNAGEIRGRLVVQTPSGMAAASAADISIAHSIVHVTSDSTGRFVIRNMGGGDYTLSAIYSIPGAGHPDSALSLPVHLAAGGAVDLGTIQLVVAGSVNGNVLIAGTQTPAAGAALIVLDRNQNQVTGIPTARSDGNGLYDLPYALEGNAYVKAIYVDAEGHTTEALSQQFTVQPRVSSHVDLSLTPLPPGMVAPTGSLEAQATYVHPLTTVAATLTPESICTAMPCPMLPQPIVESDLSPQAIVFTAVPTGLYTLTVTAPGLEPIVVPDILIDGDISLGTLVFTAPVPAPGQPTDCNDNGIPACTNGMTSGCDTDDDSDGIPDALEDPQCLCRPGGKLLKDGTCGPLDPCAGVTCDPHATCSSPDGIVALCACDTSMNYYGTGLSCSFVDPCAANPCDSHAACTDVPGSYMCACNTGYTGDGKICLDTMECEDGTAHCDTNATCTDSPGSFACACNTGYSGDGMTCLDARECEDGTGHCGANATCTDSPGSFTCACNSGYAGDGMTCNEVPVFTQFVINPSPVLKGAQLLQATLTVNEAVTSVDLSMQTGTGMPLPWVCSMLTGPTEFSCTYPLTGSEAPIGVLTAYTVTATALGGPGGTSGTAQQELDFDYRPVLSIDPAGVQYTYSPGGSADSETIGSFTLPAGPYYLLAAPDSSTPNGYQPVTAMAATAFTLDAGPIATLNVWSDAAGTQSIGHITPNGDGTWPITPLTANSSSVIYVSAVDTTGHESAPVAVPREEFVSTPNDPNATLTGVFAQNGPGGSGGVVSPANDSTRETGTFGPQHAGVFVNSSAWWSDHAPGASTPYQPRLNDAMAFDASRNRLVRFGGIDGSGKYPNDVWEFDGSAWTQIQPATGPSGRTGHALVYDGALGEVVLFGGVDAGGTRHNDLWAWDGTAWTQLAAGGRTTPTPRTGAAAAFETQTESIVFFGGLDASGTALQDTWTWRDGVWLNLPPNSPPPARSGAVMDYDVRAGQIVMYGGQDSSGKPLGDTWTWTAGVWAPSQFPAIPTVLTGASMTYDFFDGVSLLFGGSTGTTSSNALWSFSTDGWQPYTVQGGLPPARQGASLVADPATGEYLLAGGFDAAQPGKPLSDVWRLAHPGVNAITAAWTNVTPSTAWPSARTGASVVFDSSTGTTLVFGGKDVATNQLLNDLWAWNGAAWTQLTPTGSAPAPRWHAAAAFDTQGNKLVLYGGEGPVGTGLSDLWQWDGAAWTQQMPTNTGHTACCGVAAAFDSKDNVTEFFGGATDPTMQTLSNATDLWVTSNNWVTFDGVTIPVGLWGAAMAFDSTSGLMLLQGGSTGTGPIGQTWSGSLTAWTPAQTPTTPGPLVQAAVSDAPNLGGVVLFGGQSAVGTDAANSTWYWNGTTWLKLDAPAQPPSRFDQGMAWDTNRSVGVMFGGSSNAQSSGFPDVWELNAPVNSGPALQFDTYLGPEGIAPSQVTGVLYRAICGGQTSDQTGASLSAWDYQVGGVPDFGPGWQQLTINTAGAQTQPPYVSDTSQLMTGAITPAEAAIQQGAGRISLQCSTLDGNGFPTLAAAAYMEVRVQYGPARASVRGGGSLPP